ncbi:MAG: adenylate cyclase [Verrucomicrobiaceae bacterium]|nr:adenylate cyclase [Verrucomicrobiaceae bacterium]
MSFGRQSGAELIERILAEVHSIFPSASAQPAGKDQLRKRLSRLLDDSGYHTQPPERRAVTILVAELRGFDAGTEQSAPAVVVNLFNRYLTVMTEIIERHGGTLDGRSSHALTVLFGAPAPNVKHAADALACAAEMQQAMSRFNQQNEMLQLSPLFMGIGINSGDAIVGAVGATLRREYTVLGHVVAVTSRIAAHSLRGQVLLSDNSYRLVHEFVLVGELNSLRLRGRRLPINVYELLGTTRPRALTVPRREVRKSPRVPVQIPCYFQKIKGAAVLETLHCGQVLDVSYHGLRMISPIQLDACSEVKMVLSLQLLGSRTSDVYARIVSADLEQQGYRCSMEFTDIDVAGRLTIKQFVDSQVCAV